MRGPWMQTGMAAEWAGVTLDDLWWMIDQGRLEVLRLTSTSHRVRENEVAQVYGLCLPGPRSIEIAHEKALYLNQVWERKRKPKSTDEWLYLLYNAEGHLLYVGITNQCVKRFDQHGRERSWWREVKTIEVEHFDTRAEVEARELHLIRTSMPRYNTTNSPLGPVAA